MAEETTPSLNSSNNTTNVQSSKVPAGRFSGHSLASACSSAIKSYLNNVNNHANPMKTLENAANSGPLLDEASNQTIPPTSLKNTNRQLGEQLLLEEVGNHAIGTKQQTLSPTSFVNTNRQLSGHLLLEEVGDHAIGTQQQTLPRVILEDNSRQLGIPILEEVSTHTNTQNPLENSSRLLDGALVLEEGQDTGVDRRMLSRNDREEEEDSSDICSLPECDSDLLEVNPDAPHINSPADVVLPSFEGVTPSSYQGVLPIPSNTAHLHDGDDDEQHSLIAVVNSENIERLIESVNTEAVGVLVFNAHDDTAHQGGYESGVDSELNNSPICIYSSPEASPCPMDVVPSATAYANETVNEKLPTPLVFQDNTLSEDRIGSSGAATADDVASGSCEKRTVQLMEIEPINESTIETPSLLVTASAKQSPVPLAAATKRAGTSADVIPSTTPFLLMQKMLKGETDFHLPPDTKRWSTDEVSQFLRWLVGILRTEGPLIPYDEFQIDGKLLFKIRKRNLQRLFPESAVDVLWMHVEALKFASVTALNNPSLQAANAVQHKLNVGQQQKQQQQKQLHTSSTVSMNAGPANRAKSSTTEGYSSPGSGQIQLWQFLLELLTERNMGHTICWVGDEGAFKLVDPERVAQLWGERKNKPSMNYEKLSRALRYYYDGDLIHKVCGKRFVYQFVCDLKMLLGYSAAELSKLVNER